MAKLYFRYGTVNSSKTAQLLMVRHNYIQQGKDVLTLLPSVDTRDGGTISSRALQEKVSPDILVYEDTFIFDVISSKIDTCEIHAILVDEVQFLSPEHINDLWAISKSKDIPVLCYGLRNDFKQSLFPATKKLLSLADTIEEIKTVCQYCNRKASFNLQLSEDGAAIFDGDSVSIGYHFLPVCGNCYLRIKGYSHKIKEIPNVNYIEDFELTNGKTENKCVNCGVIFLGHKDRLICNRCTKSMEE